jgi:predicted nucleotidyltransferase
MHMTAGQIRKRLRETLPILQKKYGVRALYLFGSYARGEANENSDIDLLVDFDDTPDLLSFIEMETYLEKRLGKRVDMVPRRKLKARLRDSILHQAQAI